jgi:hypothetical protein
MEIMMRKIIYFLTALLFIQFRCAPERNNVYIKNTSKSVIYILSKKESRNFEKIINPNDSLKIAENEYELDFYLDATQKQYCFYILDINFKIKDSIFIKRFDLKKNEVIIFK